MNQTFNQHIIALFKLFGMVSKKKQVTRSLRGTPGKKKLSSQPTTRFDRFKTTKCFERSLNFLVRQSLASANLVVLLKSFIKFNKSKFE